MCRSKIEVKIDPPFRRLCESKKMDLPTCPSCGQSVLDDDAADCPFCGAAMDGKKTAKAPKAVKKKKATRKPPADEAEDDPFAVARTPSAGDVIPCARKPVRGRSQRVVCPMCDTQGFVPKSAFGKQVKCANKECLVPIFTAEGKGGEGAKPKAPSRAAQENKPARKVTTEDAGTKKPYVMYGIVGLVLVGGTAAFVAWSNSQGEDSLGPMKPIRPVASNNDPEPDEPEDSPDQPAPTVVEEVPEYQKRALLLVEDMISHSRVNTGNRDKAFCRRLTADAYLLLGQPSEAQAEFEQMARVSREPGRKTQFYKIIPFLNQYWLSIQSGEEDAAEYLNQAVALKEQIPERGGLAIQSSIHLAATLVHSGDVASATAVCSKMNVDRTVESRVDSVVAGAWESLFPILTHNGREPYSPLAMQLWKRPVPTAVAAELAIRQEWESALNWVQSIEDKDVAADALTVVAQEASRAGQEDVFESLTNAATSGDEWVQLRIEAVLAGRNAERWETLKARLNGMTAPEVAGSPSAGDLVEGRLPNADQDLRIAAAFAEAVISAGLQQDTDTGSKALLMLERQTAATVAPASTIRKLSNDVDNRDKTEQMLSQTLGIRDRDRLKPQFFRYRNSVDRLLKISEVRRREMLFLVCHIIHESGVDVVRQTLSAENSTLKAELAMDQTQGLLYVAAALRGIEFPEGAEMSREQLVAQSRGEALPELAVAPLLATAAKAALEGQFEPMARLESVGQRQGLCTTIFRIFVHRQALKSDNPASMIENLVSLKSDLLREQCLQESARTMTLNGLMGKTIGAVNSTVRKPTQQVAALYGIVSGAVELQKRTDTESSDQASTN